MYYLFRYFGSGSVLAVLALFAIISYCFWMRSDTQMQQEHVVSTFDASTKPLLALTPGKYKVYYEYYKRSRYYSSYPVVQLLDQNTNQLINVSPTAAFAISPMGSWGKSRVELGSFYVSRSSSYCIAAENRSWRYGGDTLTITGPLPGTEITTVPNVSTPATAPKTAAAPSKSKHSKATHKAAAK